eukprot:Hpha_TRINITY_DN29931_c0_g1::TRINITY_DN29931_c0_g1_i1::g.131950::m.131950/K18461/WASH1; WAS protein family homolog 1
MPSFVGPGGPLHEVPIVFSTARREQHGLEAALKALEKLDDVATAVFEGISAKVAEQRERVNDLQERMEEAKEKIDQVSGRSQATTVISSYKYMADKAWDNARVTGYDESSLHRIRGKKIRDQKIYQKGDSMPEEEFSGMPSRPRNPAETFEVGFYYYTPGKRDTAQAASSKGLGHLPKSLCSVSSLLLFNTNENPYREYGVFDPLAQEGKKRIIEEKKNVLGQRPANFGGDEGGYEQGGDREGFAYEPEARDVPDFDEMPDKLFDDAPDFDWDDGWAGFEEQAAEIVPSNRHNRDDVSTVYGGKTPRVDKEKAKRPERSGGG